MFENYIDTMQTQYSSFSTAPRSIHIIPVIREIIFNKPYTIVKWSDGTETTVRCIDKDTFDKETGVAMAITKKYFQRISPSHRSELKKCIRFAKDYSNKKKNK